MFDWVVQFAVKFWAIVAQMSPYLLFGFLVAGFLSILVPAAMVERHLGGRGLWPVIKASMFGVPLPLCSCGVIPVAASLKRHGATNGATTAFLLSTPETGVDSMVVTFSLLGPVIGIMRPVFAFLTGLVGGTAVALFGPPNGGNEAAPQAARAGTGETGPAGAAGEAARALEMKCEGACCMEAAGGSKLFRALHYGFITLPQDLSKALIVGIFVAALITILIPPDYFAGKAIGSGITGMLFMMALGIPTYVCATASVPVAAALIAAGVSPGAAMVFLITGPGTNAATLSIVWKIMGRRTALIYLGTIATMSLAVGLIIDYWIRLKLDITVAHEHPMFSLFDNVAGVVLAGLIAFGLWRQWRGPREVAREASDAETIFAVGGMHCSHCSTTIERVLRECAGVECATVDLKQGTATITGKGVDVEAAKGKITDLGYTVEDKPRK